MTIYRLPAIGKDSGRCVSVSSKSGFKCIDARCPASYVIGRDVSSYNDAIQNFDKRRKRKGV